MKTIRSISFVLFTFVFGFASKAQDLKEESFNVSGNCGMCKTTIEKAAKAAGVDYADWNKETKILTIRYKTQSTHAAKVQEEIAKAGYDNAGAKATKESYDKLPACCKYERGEKSAEMASCCADKKCEAGKCAEGKCTDGKCADGKECKGCKGEKGHKGEKNVAMDCCKNGKCEKHS